MPKVQKETLNLCRPTERRGAVSFHRAPATEPWDSARAHPVCHTGIYLPCHGRGHPSRAWLRRPWEVLLSHVFHVPTVWHAHCWTTTWPGSLGSTVLFVLIVVWEKCQAGKVGYCFLKAQSIRTHYSLGLLGAPGCFGKEGDGGV